MGLFGELTYNQKVPRFVGQPIEDIKEVGTELRTRYKTNIANQDMLETTLSNLKVRVHNQEYVNEALAKSIKDIQDITNSGRWEDAGRLIDNSVKTNYVANKGVQGSLQDMALYQADLAEKEELLKKRLESGDTEGGITQEMFDLYFNNQSKNNSKKIEIDPNTGTIHNLYQKGSIPKYVDINKRVNEYYKTMKPSEILDNYNRAGVAGNIPGYYKVSSLEGITESKLKQMATDYIKSNPEVQGYLNWMTNADYNARFVTIDQQGNKLYKPITLDDLTRVGVPITTEGIKVPKIVNDRYVDADGKPIDTSLPGYEKKIIYEIDTKATNEILPNGVLDQNAAESLYNGYYKNSLARGYTDFAEDFAYIQNKDQYLKNWLLEQNRQHAHEKELNIITGAPPIEWGVNGFQVNTPSGKNVDTINKTINDLRANETTLLNEFSKKYSGNIYAITKTNLATHLNNAKVNGYTNIGKNRVSYSELQQLNDKLVANDQDKSYAETRLLAGEKYAIDKLSDSEKRDYARVLLSRLPKDKQNDHNIIDAILSNKFSPEFSRSILSDISAGIFKIGFPNTDHLTNWVPAIAGLPGSVNKGAIAEFSSFLSGVPIPENNILNKVTGAMNEFYDTHSSYDQTNTAKNTLPLYNIVNSRPILNTKANDALRNNIYELIGTNGTGLVGKHIYSTDSKELIPFEQTLGDANSTGNRAVVNKGSIGYLMSPNIDGGFGVVITYDVFDGKTKVSKEAVIPAAELHSEAFDLITNTGSYKAAQDYTNAKVKTGNIDTPVPSQGFGYNGSHANVMYNTANPTETIGILNESGNYTWYDEPTGLAILGKIIDSNK